MNKENNQMSVRGSVSEAGFRLSPSSTSTSNAKVGDNGTPVRASEMPLAFFDTLPPADMVSVGEQKKEQKSMLDNQTKARELAKAMVEVMRCVAEVIKHKGSIPNGHLYARLAGALSLGEYTLIIDVLKHAGVVKESNYVLTWTGPATQPTPSVGNNEVLVFES